MKYLSILPIIFILASCGNSAKKPAISTQPSIYKIWQFKTIDTTTSPYKKASTAWIGNNLLDLTNKDTLKFSYGNTHNKPTAYGYRISKDTIFIQNKPGYKIIKLTDGELRLLIVFNSSAKKNPIKSDSIVMIYQKR